MRPVPLFGSGISSFSQVVTSQRRLNCFYDLRQDGDSSEMIVRGTPGWLAALDLGMGPIRGFWVVGGNMYVVSANKLFKVSPLLLVTTLGTLANASTFVSMSDNQTQILIVDGVAGYILTIATGVLTVIGDAAFPNGATTCTFIDGRFIVNKINTRQYYISAFYDGTIWSPSIFASKENSSDNLVAADVLNGTIILWGASTMEFWQDVGASPNPFARINGATQTWGLGAVFSRAFLSNTMIFLGVNPQGSVQVMKLSGYVPTRISTSDVENIINNFGTFTDAVALTYMVDGHPMYQLTFPTGNRSFLYDDLTGQWGEVQTGLALTGRHFGQIGTVFNTINYISDASSGVIYAINENAYTDNGAAVKRQVRTRHVHANGNDFSGAEVVLVMETGVGLQNGQGSDPQVAMRISKDGGRTFGYSRTTSLGKVGQYRAPRVRFRRLGSGRDFVFEFTVTDPVKFVIAYGALKTAQMEGSDG